MKFRHLTFAATCLGYSLMGGDVMAQSGQIADTVFHNGSILTMAPGRHHVVVSTALA